MFDYKYYEFELRLSLVLIRISGEVFTKEAQHKVRAGKRLKWEGQNKVDREDEGV